MQFKKAVDKIFEAFLSPKTKEAGERSILVIAIVSYLIHLAFIILSKQGILEIDSKFFESPIAAIYTPFTFILIYEVYLLIFFLPKSISYYIGKQYEIITLIVIRRIFKDIASIELSSEWFHIKSDLQFTYDSITSLILFIVIFYFYRSIAKRNLDLSEEGETNSSIGKIKRFIALKKIIAVLLVPLLVFLSFYSFYHWAVAAISDYQNGLEAFKNINHVFFDEFFTVLIVVDVLLLLASFFYTDKFHIIIRNSGFIISTILIKVSFSVDGLVNNALIIGAVIFGFLMLLIHNKFEASPLVDEKV